MRQIILFLILSFFLLFGLNGQIWVYNYPDTIVNTNKSQHLRSNLIDIKVMQGNITKTAYVMFDKNQETSGNQALNPNNHWTNFSMKGTVTIKITRKDNYNMTYCKVFPLKKGIIAHLSGKTASFDITETQLPLQLYVEINDMGNNAILIFADPEETDVPSKTDTNVELIRTTDDINTVRAKLQSSKTFKYFEEGIHQWGSKTGTDYPGYKLPLISGKKIYIPGGAYVIGTFAGSPANNKIFGRGVISCAGKDRIANTEGIPYSVIMSDGSGLQQQYEGIVILSPPHFHVTIRGNAIVNNLKMLGWWHQTDGVVTGEGSTVINCFFKVNDDVIKLYSDNCYYENNTIFQQTNGAPFQFSWGSQHSKNNVIKNTYVVNSIYKNLNGTSNTAIINARSGKEGNITENQKWFGLYIDNGCHRLLGLEPNGGTHRNYEIRDVELNTGNKDKPQRLWSYMQNGNFSDIKLINFRINGYNITTTKTDSDKPELGCWWYQGVTNALSIIPTY